MELYDKVSFSLSEKLTIAYSTSFSRSMKLFPKNIRQHIAAIYGLVRIADEIVDTYKKQDAAELLLQLEKEAYSAIHRGYSTNPIVHAFALSAIKYDIKKDIIQPFFDSMRIDLNPQSYNQKLYASYIHGSAEVVGLMCLKVFVSESEYAQLENGAKHLGAAYQKINFLRDIKADWEDLGRWYFPHDSFDTFNDVVKQRIIDDINKDLAIAIPAAKKLPKSARPAVALSIAYYQKLLEEISLTPASILKTKRIRVSDAKKLALFIKAKVRA